MRKTFSTLPLIAGFALAASLAFAQEPPKANPQMPATPSMDQKGAGDMSKPAGGAKPMAPAADKGDMSKGSMSKGGMKKGGMAKGGMMSKKGHMSMHGKMHMMSKHHMHGMSKHSMMKHSMMKHHMMHGHMMKHHMSHKAM